VTGITTFDVVPNVGGADVWYPGNDGSGSGLDADTLDGFEASAFAVASDPLTITGAWEFQTAPLLNAANDDELIRYQDTTNNLQIQNKFDTNLDWALIPGTGGVFEEDDRFYYDSTLNRWSSNTDFAITADGGALYMQRGVNAIAAVTTEPTIGDGPVFGTSALETFLESDTGAIQVKGVTSTNLQSGFLLKDGSTTDGRVGFFDGAAELVIEDVNVGAIRIESLTGSIDITASAPCVIDGGEIQLNLSGVSILIGQDYTSATTVSSARVRDGGGTLRDVGFNVMPNDDQGAAFTIGVTNAGHKERYTGAGSEAVTLTDEANIPDGATWVIVNAGTGSLDITITTLTWYDGSGTIQTGNRVLAIAGVATITKRIDGQYEIWGAGLT
jgi:hypothetical protein